jgi:hypothetical protein
MQVHLLKLMYHDRLGKIKAGRVVDLPEHQAKEWIKHGIAESYQTKVIRQDPLPHAGVVTQSSALPVEEVSTVTTSTPLKRGAKPKKTKTKQL